MVRASAAGPLCGVGEASAWCWFVLFSATFELMSAYRANLLETETGDGIVGSIFEEIMAKAMRTITERHIERHVNARAVEMAFNASMYVLEVRPEQSWRKIVSYGTILSLAGRVSPRCEP